MKIQFEGAGERRKELVKAMAEVLGRESKYLGAPGFAFQVGDYTVLRNGDVETDDFIDPKALGQFLVGMLAKGFMQIGNAFAMPEKAPSESEVLAAQNNSQADWIEQVFPKTDMTDQVVANLKKLVEGKGWLIKQALEVSELPVVDDGDVLRFRWLPSTAPHALIEATTHLQAALIKLSKKQKRVTLTAKETDNPRYAFRCFLLRLGFIGNEYKSVRKTLMDGIPGNGSVRYIEMAKEVEMTVSTKALEKVLEPGETKKGDSEL